MNWLTDEQIRRNAASQDKWDLARPHRERVTELIGAGNCNELVLDPNVAAVIAQPVLLSH